MKVFKFDKSALTYVPHSAKFYSKLTIFTIIISVLLSILLFYGINNYYKEYKKKQLDEEMKLIILQEHNKFEEIKFVKALQDLNIKFPHIVYAQAILESQSFTSNIFKENNNMFGMKVATQRQTTNRGEQYGHAFYDTWRDCVIDYALYQARYLPSIKTDDQYYMYLQQSYAEDPTYINKLKVMVTRLKIKEKFNS